MTCFSICITQNLHYFFLGVVTNYLLVLDFSIFLQFYAVSHIILVLDSRFWNLDTELSLRCLLFFLRKILRFSAKIWRDFPQIRGIPVHELHFMQCRRATYSNQWQRSSELYFSKLPWIDWTWEVTGEANPFLLFTNLYYDNPLLKYSHQCNISSQESCTAALEKYGVGSCGPRGFYGTIGKAQYLI